ncbi:TlpA disulfide reductase family protein [Porticoccaceae bacterium LTM1]|nr:TlpA disulfide reductase family protein [Porticoccaceae bacterium LTM1]
MFKRTAIASVVAGLALSMSAFSGDFDYVLEDMAAVKKQIEAKISIVPDKKTQMTIAQQLDFEVELQSLMEMQAQTVGLEAEAYRLAELKLYMDYQNKKFKKVLKKVVNDVPASSYAWSAFPELAGSVAIHLPKVINQKAMPYIDGLRSNSSADVVAHVEGVDLLYMIFNGQLPKAEATYDRLSKTYPDMAVLEQAKQQLEHLRTKPHVGKEAMDFSVANLQDESETFSLDSFKGKYVLLDFWATWCGPCVKELPNVLTVYNQYHDQGLEILSLSGDQSPEDVLEFLDGGEAEMPWNHAFLGAGGKPQMAKDYQVRGFPTMFLIDPEGKIVAMGDSLRGHKLNETISKLMN